MDTTSNDLKNFLADVDKELQLTVEEIAQDARERRELLESIEGLCFGTTDFTAFAVLRDFAKNRGLPVKEVTATQADRVAHSLDDCLSRLMVEQIPTMVSRALHLSALIVPPLPADRDLYLREATRCYLFGLFNASVALSRSALEYALLDSVPKMLQVQSRAERLKGLINAACHSILKGAPDVCELADRVRRRANRVVHKRPCEESEALEVLRETRDVVHFLYNPDFVKSLKALR